MHTFEIPQPTRCSTAVASTCSAIKDVLHVAWCEPVADGYRLCMREFQYPELVLSHVRKNIAFKKDLEIVGGSYSLPAACKTVLASSILEAEERKLRVLSSKLMRINTTLICPNSGHQQLIPAAMGEVSDYQFAYFNNIIYNEQDPDGPVSDFRRFSGSGKLESGLAAITCIREDQVCH